MENLAKEMEAWLLYAIEERRKESKRLEAEADALAEALGTLKSKQARAAAKGA